jgi:hypothetical protein
MYPFGQLAMHAPSIKKRPLLQASHVSFTDEHDSQPLGHVRHLLFEMVVPSGQDCTH